MCYQLFVVDLLSDEFVFTQRVASFSCDGVDRPFLHLLLYGAVQHEERLAGTLLTDRQRQAAVSHLNPPLLHIHPEKSSAAAGFNQSSSFLMNKLTAAQI